MTPILLFLLFPTVIHGCLVIRFSAPPKCECVSMTLDQSNVQETVGNLDFYKNLTNYPISKPIIKIDDCSVSVYCERDSSLVIFDKEDANMFGAYAADGFCDPYKQKWIIEKESELKTYDKMNAVCVDYANKTDKCKCPHVLIDSENAAQYFSSHNKSKSILGSKLVKPENFTFDENSCMTSFECSHRTYVVFPDRYEDSTKSVRLDCDQDTNQFTVKMEPTRQKNITETVPIAYMSCYTLPPAPVNSNHNETPINFR
ncbi:unnamed protein product [Caenorhabditis nigoni]